MRSSLRTLITEAVIKRFVGNLGNGHNRQTRNITANAPNVGNNKDYNYTKTSVCCYYRSMPKCPAVGTLPPNKHEATYRCSHCLTDTAYQCRFKMHMAI